MICFTFRFIMKMFGGLKGLLLMVLIVSPAILLSTQNGTDVFALNIYTEFCNITIQIGLETIKFSQVDKHVSLNILSYLNHMEIYCWLLYKLCLVPIIINITAIDTKNPLFFVRRSGKSRRGWSGGRRGGSRRGGVRGGRGGCRRSRRDWRGRQENIQRCRHNYLVHETPRNDESR